jgi:membrane fusion protein (multidrug efflux system)
MSLIYDPNSLPGLRGRLYVRTAAALLIMAVVLAGCHKTAPAAVTQIPEVTVTNVIQEDVPIYSNWVGTTEGFVNALIHPKVSGYILKQAYQDGDHVRAGQLLFQIDPRE